MTSASHDLITIGRVSMDLFAEDIGANFTDITGFETGVGGSPSNIAIGSSRLGLKTALLTAVGDDEVGKFVLNYLQKESIDIRFIPRKAEARTGMAVVGVQPPDKFPLVFYREDPADIHLTLDDAIKLPIATSRALQLSGTALSRGTCRDVTLYAAEEATRHSVTTFMDLDLRPDQWSHPLTYGLNIRAVVSHLDVIIGTEEECYAAFAPIPNSVMEGKQITDLQKAEVESILRSLADQRDGPHTVVLKRGAKGVTIIEQGNKSFDIPGYPVKVLNTVGAGDAFASGLIYGYLQDMGWEQAAQFANACGAIVVTRHGCGTAMPTKKEVTDFMTVRR
ncbi:MAG: 5-dehydro-2-deoxygluconokinase [Chloroflexota bacterium]